MFTGIITEKVIDSISQDKLIGSFVTLEEASKEVGKICNAYKNDDIDLTILLTHIGIESDKQLASMLDPAWGVDMIIGGHSHTILERPEKVNNILIVQAGTSTNQVGRFDIVVDDDTNSIVDYKWQMVDITSDIVKPDQKLLEFIESFKKEVDAKYSAIITRFSQKLIHPERTVETPLGNLIADIFAQNAQCDVMFCGSGAIRLKELGPIVTLSDIISCFPYNDSITRYTIQGSKLKRIFSHIMRFENRDGEGECYQVSRGIQAIYDDKNKKLISLTFNKKPVDDYKTYTIAMSSYTFNGCAKFLDVSQEEMTEDGPTKVVTTSSQDILIEYLRSNQNQDSKIEGRLIYR